MKMAVLGICKDPLKPSLSSWPAPSDTNTSAMTATAHSPTVLKITTASRTLRHMSTVRFAPSSTEVLTVSWTA